MHVTSRWEIKQDKCYIALGLRNRPKQRNRCIIIHSKIGNLGLYLVLQGYVWGLNHFIHVSLFVGIVRWLRNSRRDWLRLFIHVVNIILSGVLNRVSQGGLTQTIFLSSGSCQFDVCCFFWRSYIMFLFTIRLANVPAKCCIYRTRFTESHTLSWQCVEENSWRV